MKKLFLFSWLMMLSIVATAQSIIVVDKDGNRISYDPTKVTSVDFQTTPPGFTVRQATSSDLYLFDKVSSVKGLPDHLFVYPDTALVKTEGESFALQVKASVEYVATPSERWLTIDDDAKDGQQYVTALPNPTAEERTGYIAFASKDQSLTDTLWVIQAGMQLSWIKLVNPSDEEMLPGTPHKLTYRLLYMDEAGQGTGIPGYSMKLRMTGNGVFDNQQKEIILTSDEDGLISTNVTCSSLEEGGGLVQILQPEQEYALPQNPTWIFHPTSFRLVSMKPQQLIEAGQKSVDVSFKLIRTMELFSVDETSDLEGISVLTYKHLSTTELAYPEQQIHFSAQNGGADVRSAKTDEMGVATATFTPSGDDFTEGTLTGTYYVELAEDDISDIKAVTHITKASLTVTPDTVRVRADGEDFTFVVTANTDYDIKPSASWLTEPTELPDVDGVMVYSAAMNPSTEQRIGYLTFVTASGLTTDTLYVVQAGKTDSRYIDIDWETTTLDSYDPETGVAVLSFAGDVPVMGEYDVVLLPEETGNLLIRVIETVEQADKTVTLTTSEGDLGNLFKDTEFSLDFDINNEVAAARGTTASNSFRPVKIEDFDGEKFVEIYNVDQANSLARRAQDPQLNFRFSATGTEFYKSETASMSFVKHMLQFTLKGTSTFSFGKDTSGKVPKGTTQSAGFFVEGTTYSDIEVRCQGYNAYELLSKGDKVTLKQNAIKRKFTFNVKGIPVVVFLNGDIIAEYYINTEGKVDMTAGVIAQDKIKYGVTLKESDMTVPVVVTENEKQLEMVYPSLDDIGGTALQSSKLYATVDVYPNLSMSLFGTSATASIAPMSAVIMEAYGNKVDNSHWAINEKVRAAHSLGITAKKIPGMSKELGGTKSIYDEKLIAIPERIRLLNNTPEELLVGDTKEVEFQVTHKDFTKQEYKSEGALVKLEAEGGEFTGTSAEGSNQVIYKYADEEGNVSVSFKLTDAEKKMGKVTATVMQGDPNANDIPEAVWEAKASDYSITCETPNLTIKKGEKQATAIFYLEKYDAIYGHIGAWPDQEVTFIATGGTVAPKTAKTDSQGKVYVTFTAEEGATEGTIIATTVVKGNDINWEGRATAKVTIEGESTIDDELLKKAEKLRENTYEIKNKKTGDTEIRDYKTQWSEWTKGTDGIEFVLEDADDDGGTKGMLEGFIPINMSGLVLMLTGQQFENSPGAMLYFGVYDGKFRLSANFKTSTGFTSSNLKPESRIMLRPVKSVSPARRFAPGDEEEEYTGEYELLFYLAFQNTMNPMTGEEEEGDEYEVYGRGTMTMHIPTVTYFVAHAEKDWVKVGESTKVILDRYDEEGATWDWNDTQIIGQSTDYSKARNGEDEGFFSWDPATQTLTSLKPNDNKRVNVCLGLKSKPSVKQTLYINTGNGWNYTMIKPSKDEFTYTGYGYLAFSFDFAPRESENEKIDFNALEIDPETNPNGYFSIQRGYGPQGWPIYVNNAPAGEYTVRIWVRDNHDVNCTIKVISTLEE